jgi:hypothetical protein
VVNEQNGYAFIGPDTGGKDVFFHDFVAERGARNRRKILSCGDGGRRPQVCGLISRRPVCMPAGLPPVSEGGTFHWSVPLVVNQIYSFEGGVLRQRLAASDVARQSSGISIDIAAFVPALTLTPRVFA